jgi:hypothetical protein
MPFGWLILGLFSPSIRIHTIRKFMYSSGGRNISRWKFRPDQRGSGFMDGRLFQASCWLIVVYAAISSIPMAFS